MSNILSSFPTINDGIREKLKFNIGFYDIYSNINNDISKLEFTPNEEIENSFFVDDEYNAWNPNQNDLNIKYKLHMENLDILFNRKNGVTERNAKLGLALTWYCKKTKQIQTLKLKEFEFSNDNASLVFEGEISFVPGSLSEKLNLRFIIYLVKNDLKDMMASTEGTILGIIDEYEIILEGDGSLFPIEQIDDTRSNFTYEVNINYTDLYEEFDKDHICLLINSSKLENSSENILKNELFKEILSDFFISIFQDIKDKGYDINSILENEYDDNTIGKAVQIWISTMNIKYDSYINLSKSIRKYIYSL